MSHDHDEVMYILEGGFSMGARRCGPGTVVFIEAETQYGFEVWDEGVRFLNIRPGLARYAERRVHNGLDRVCDRVRQVLVRLADVNGPRGGDDKHCVVSVRLASGDHIRVNALDACPYRAVDGAVNRLKRVVTERRRRRRDRRRRR